MIGGIRQHLPKMKLKRFWREKMSKCIKCGRELTSAEIPEFYNSMREMIKLKG